MSEKEKINETDHPILTDALTPVKKPRKPRKKKMVENGILDESVIPEDTIPESSRLTEKTPEPVKEETYEGRVPTSTEDKEENPVEPAVTPSPTFLERCKAFFAKQAPFWNQPLTIGKAVLIALIACVISSSISCAGISKINTRLDSLENSSSLSAAYLNWIMSPFGAAEAQISSGKRVCIQNRDQQVAEGTDRSDQNRDEIAMCHGAGLHQQISVGVNTEFFRNKTVSICDQ